MNKQKKKFSSFISNFTKYFGAWHAGVAGADGAAGGGGPAADGGGGALHRRHPARRQVRGGGAEDQARHHLRRVPVPLSISVAALC